LSGLGGDPHESVAVTVKKYGAYRFRYNRHRSDYFYEDILVRPQDASIEGSTGGDFHHYDFERTRDNASLGIDFSERAKVTFDFDRYEKKGDSTTTVDVEREEFEVQQPIDETMRSSTLGFQYAWDRVTLIVSERWQRHDNDFSWVLPGFSLGTEPTEPTELDFFFLDQPYQQDVREHAVSVHMRPTDKLKLSVDVRDIDLDMDIDVAESSQGLDYTGTPFTRDLQGAGDVDRATTLINFGADYALTERFQIGANIRHYSLDQDGVMSFDNNLATTDWEVDYLGFELSAQAALTEEIQVAAGWHSERRETKFVETATAASFSRAEDTDQDGFFMQASYQPDKHLRLTLTAEENRIDDPFTLASATDSRRYRLRGRYRFDNGLSLTASHRLTEYENDNTDWQSTTKQTDVRLAYALDRLALTAGFGLIDLEREIDQRVTGGFRQDLFAIRYQADATFWDATADFSVNDQFSLSASLRRYENDGSFDVERDDIHLGVSYTLPQDYVLTVNYRNVDYMEGHIEEFDADIWELSLRIAW
jgi:predicted porin